MPKIQDLTALADCAERAAEAAAQYIRRTPRPDPGGWEGKSAADFVTAVDRTSESIISEVLISAEPSSTIVGEESSPEGGMDRGLVWVVDPLDGTTNYLHGYPVYAVSIAALLEGELVAGSIIEVPTHIRYRAIKGGGAWREDDRLRVSTITDPRQALLGTGFPFKEPANQHTERYLRQFKSLLEHTSGLRRAGAAALDLADVAQGRFEAFFEYELKAWDMAAGMLLVREAGGVVTDFDGNDAPVAHGSIVAGNAAIHPWVRDRLRAIA